MINYLIGLATLPVICAIVFGWALAGERGHGHRCKICGHQVSSSHRAIVSWCLWEWHSYVGCFVRGMKDRREWVEARGGN